MKKLIAVAVTLLLIVSNDVLARDVLNNKEKAVIMKEVARELLDPESARFKWPKIAQDVNMKAPDVAVTYCGLV